MFKSAFKSPCFWINTSFFLSTAFISFISAVVKAEEDEDRGGRGIFAPSSPLEIGLNNAFKQVFSPFSPTSSFFHFPLPFFHSIQPLPQPTSFPYQILPFNVLSNGFLPRPSSGLLSRRPRLRTFHTQPLTSHLLHSQTCLKLRRQVVVHELGKTLRTYSVN